jgi:hypothetical protein
MDRSPKGRTTGRDLVVFDSYRESKSVADRRYSTPSQRSVIALAAVLGIVVGGVHSTGVSHASPSDDDANGQCSFALTPPKVVQVSGLSLVEVTMRPGPCTIRATPNSSTVCLSAAGSGTQGQCASAVGHSPAEARYPYQPGTTYVVRGQGCAERIEPPYKLCQNFGPMEVTL